MDRWVGKVAVVTGASAGIGEVLVELLAKAGVHVVALARRREKLEELAAKLNGAKGKVYPKQCDLNKEDDIVNSLNWVETTLGGIDILINNAGYGKRIKIADDNPDSYRHMMNVNVIAMAITIKLAIASMKKRDVPGSIINLNSIAGHENHAGKFPGSLYCASKHAVTALTESVRQELANEPNNKIRITSLSPGVVRTEFVSVTGAANAATFYDNWPCLNAIDVANAAIYILSAPQNVLVSELTIRHVRENF